MGHFNCYLACRNTVTKTRLFHMWIWTYRHYLCEDIACTTTIICELPCGNLKVSSRQRHYGRCFWHSPLECLQEIQRHLSCWAFQKSGSVNCGHFAGDGSWNYQFYASFVELIYLYLLDSCSGRCCRLQEYILLSFICLSMCVSAFCWTQ